MSEPGERRDPTQERDQFVPVRKSDILTALTIEGALRDEWEREAFRQVCRLLASIYHYEYFDWLEKLRDAYFYFNPENVPPAHVEAAALDRNYTELVTAFDAVLKGANFVEVTHAEIERAHRDNVLVDIELRAPHEDFREVRFYRRGGHRKWLEVPRWFGWWKRIVETVIYDDVVLFVAMKPASALPANKKKRAPSRVRPGAVLLKYFRNIASADLNALFPNVKIVMSWRDRAFLGIPALVGGIPILINLYATISVLFVVVGFYLGIRGAVEDSEMKSALAALSGLVALGSFIMRQWVKYQRQSLRYQKLLTENVYFHNINNNAGLFDYIIGAAEEQESKEAFLAYYFVYTAETPPTQQEVDARIEAWLRDRFGAEIDFEVGDALAKLERLGLLGQDGGHLTVPSLEETLVRLDRLWDAYFRYDTPVRDKPAAT